MILVHIHAMILVHTVWLITTSENFTPGSVVCTTLHKKKVCDHVSQRHNVHWNQTAAEICILEIKLNDLTAGYFFPCATRPVRNQVKDLFLSLMCTIYRSSQYTFFASNKSKWSTFIIQHWVWLRWRHLQNVLINLVWSKLEQIWFPFRCR